MANIKIIQRTNEVRVLMSDQEKELVWKYAKAMGMKPSRLIRNIVMLEVESKMKYINIPIVKAYRKYLELTDPEFLKKLSEAE
jgi:hypothetical protein